MCHPGTTHSSFNQGYFVLGLKVPVFSIYIYIEYLYILILLINNIYLLYKWLFINQNIENKI